jgi:hypothetical protein
MRNFSNRFIICLVATVSVLISHLAIAENDISFSAEDALLKPVNYREWMYIGSSVTPHDKNDGKAAFPEFHNVYITRSGWQAWKETGDFADGTTIIKELASVGAHEAVTGKGYFQGEFSGIGVMVKDKQRFAKKPGNWGFFFFNNDAPLTTLATAFDDASCAHCHTAHAKKDMIFTQYYPILTQSIPVSE